MVAITDLTYQSWHERRHTIFRIEKMVAKNVLVEIIPIQTSCGVIGPWTAASTTKIWKTHDTYSKESHCS